MKGIAIIFLVLLISCNKKTTNGRVCNLDTLDYKIYSLLLEKYVFPEIDFSLKFDEKTGKIFTFKNSRRNLLLIDSTKIYVSNGNAPYLIFDSILFEDFKKRNSFKCKLDTNFNESIKFYRISNYTFRSSLKKNSIKCYDELYDIYKDVTGIVEFSKIGYNVNKTKALVEICLYRTPKNSFGVFVWLELKNGKWNIVGYKSDWIS